MIKGEKFKALLYRKGITPEDFARDFNISVSSVFKYYKKDSFDSSLLEKFAKYFNVPVGYFFEEGQGVESGDNRIDGNKNIVGMGQEPDTKPKKNSFSNYTDEEIKELIASQFDQHLMEMYENGRAYPAALVSKMLADKDDVLQKTLRDIWRLTEQIKELQMNKDSNSEPVLRSVNSKNK